MRKHDDYYSKKAKKENFAARSVYKLQEIQRKYSLIKKKHKVVDLGCSPGSWLQYIHGLLNSNGFVLGIDIKETNISLPENAKIEIANVLELNPEKILVDYGNFNGVLSDMAPKTTGNKDLDHYGSMELVEKAFEIAKVLLKPNGYFVCKMFDGEESPEFIKQARKHFNFFKALRVDATKKQSREVFLVGNGYKNI